MTDARLLIYVYLSATQSLYEYLALADGLHVLGLDIHDGLASNGVHTTYRLDVHCIVAPQRILERKNIERVGQIDAARESERKMNRER